MIAKLELQSVNYEYQEKYQSVFRVLEQVNATFETGTFYTIIGPSGVGKTTLLSLLAGLDQPSSGEILLNGESINKKIGLTNYRKRHAAMIFQSFNLIPYLTATQNIITAMNIQTKTKEKKKLALQVLKLVGLTEKHGNSSVLQLSGGQQQRVAIARSLIGEGEFLFGDEPTGNLDGETADEVVTIFQELAHIQGKAVIIVTHDLKLAEKSDVIYEVTERKLQRRKRI